MDPKPHGLIDNWLREISGTLERHRAEIDALPEAGRHARLCELNVMQQVDNMAHTTIVREAWDRGQQLEVHGWCYGLEDGLIHDLGIDVAGIDALPGALQAAIARPGPRAT
jgi:carbonic anhydrase